MMFQKPALMMTSLMVCMVLSACMPANSVRDHATVAPAVALPAGVNLTRTPVQAAWWQRFGDPVMTALIQEALQANPNIATAQANLRSARAQRLIAGAALLPGLSAGGSARRSGGSDNYGMTLDASWEADVFGLPAYDPLV